jgi:Ca-activated chloride channel family protein
VVTGTTHTGDPYELRVPATHVTTDALTAVWARAHLRDLEDEYAIGTGPLDELEKRIVTTSLQYGVLCRFTAFVAVDTRVVTDGSGTHRVTQPVELPAGWEAVPVAAAAPMMAPMAMRLSASRPAPGAATSYSGPVAEAAAADLSAGPRGFAPTPAPVPPFAKRARGGRGSATIDALRPILAEEAARLRANAAADEPTRRAILADLSTRLTAALRQLTAPEADPRTAGLRSLAADLAACDGPTPPRGADLTALYERAITTLTALTHPTTPDPTTRGSRANFWKRG